METFFQYIYLMAVEVSHSCIPSMHTFVLHKTAISLNEIVGFEYASAQLNVLATNILMLGKFYYPEYPP